MYALPEYEIVNFQCGVTTDSELTILCYGKRFHIYVSADNLHGNTQIEQEYLRKLRRLETEDGLSSIKYNEDQKAVVEELDAGSAKEPDCGDAMEELCFWIAFKCNPYMRALRSDPEPVPRTVKDWLNPETVVLTLKVNQEGNLDVPFSPASDELIVKSYIPCTYDYQRTYYSRKGSYSRLCIPPEYTYPMMVMKNTAQVILPSDQRK